jgi:hypothetical protein
MSSQTEKVPKEPTTKKKGPILTTGMAKKQKVKATEDKEDDPAAAQAAGDESQDVTAFSDDEGEPDWKSLHHEATLSAAKTREITDLMQAKLFEQNKMLKEFATSATARTSPILPAAPPPGAAAIAPEESQSMAASLLKMVEMFKPLLNRVDQVEKSSAAASMKVTPLPVWKLGASEPAFNTAEVFREMQNGTTHPYG